MTTVSLQHAQAHLSDLVHHLAPGDELIVTENNRTVARIVPPAETAATRKLGTLRGTVLYMAPDFDAPLDEFKECLK
jgi:prevent-host-death family protein